ncbi:uncharacterized protein METZ01_LOCUS470460, partial [marine metagenome]
MLNRRSFLNRGAVGFTAATTVAATGLQAAPAKSAAIGGYDYRLPTFKKGSRLL